MRRAAGRRPMGIPWFLSSGAWPLHDELETSLKWSWNMKGHAIAKGRTRKREEIYGRASGRISHMFMRHAMGELTAFRLSHEVKTTTSHGGHYQRKPPCLTLAEARAGRLWKRAREGDDETGPLPDGQSRGRDHRSFESSI